MPGVEQMRGIVDALRGGGLTIAFGESCTGGRLSADLTTVPGSSDVVAGSAVCYQIPAKRAVLGLQEVTEANVVSGRTAAGMAAGARALYDASIGVGTTGLLDGEHPHAFFAVSWPGGRSSVRRVDFDSGDARAENRERLVAEVFDALEDVLRVVR